ncbi:hypothetical protein WN943_025225 [Citrus x changshan-huyou]
MGAMGRSCRNYKSVLTRKIIALVKSNDVTRKLEALKVLKPRNIKSERQWQRFIKERISVEFKLKSKRFQKMRSKQTNIHRTSRKGMARLRHEMMQERPNSLITRVDVWIRAHTKKDETVINEDVAKKLDRIDRDSIMKNSRDIRLITMRQATRRNILKTLHMRKKLKHVEALSQNIENARCIKRSTQLHWLKLLPYIVLHLSFML